MRRDVVIALTGGAVIVLATVGLVTGALREGPLDGRLEPVRLDVHVAGIYHAAGPTDVNGLCLQPPCEARTTIDLTFHGLPQVGYDAVLEAGDRRVDLGALRPSGDAFTLRYDEAEDHRGADALVVTWGSEDVLRFLVVAEMRMAIDSTLGARVLTPPGDYHATEIGGVSVSTVVDIEIPGAPPGERQYHAWFESADGWTDLGALDSDGSGSTLDARVEHLRLEDQLRLVVYLEPEGAAPAEPVGFPVLAAEL